MLLEAVTVCVGYADFLAAVAPWNAGQLDRWIVVTEPADTETRDVCRKHSIQCVLSDDGTRDGADFAKGRLVERGLQHLRKDAWRLHLDADIALPSRTRALIEAAHLDTQGIYGADRLLVRDYAAWTAILASGYLHGQHDYHNRLRLAPGHSIGSRWVDLNAGYVPIGFFQLWHSDADLWQGARIKPYPQHHNDACRTDVQHALQWDRRHRHLLPELLVLHLESGPAPMGANWKGRTTAPFGPQVPGVIGASVS